jgi:hypothetical protein
LAGHTPGEDHALRPACFRVSDGHEGDSIPLRNASYHRSVTGDSRTPKVGLIASTTPVSRSSSTSKPSWLPTPKAAVEPSRIRPLRVGTAGVLSVAAEWFWFSGSSPQRPPGYGFSGFSPQELRGAWDPLPQAMGFRNTGLLSHRSIDATTSSGKGEDFLKTTPLCRAPSERPSAGVRHRCETGEGGVRS